MQFLVPFINRLLSYGKFKSSEIPRKYYRELLTGIEKLKRIDTVFIPKFIEVARRFEGRLIIDDVTLFLLNKKYMKFT